ncbi:hypothetical protein NL676_008982 [Syzygium grande]|nr:hypothetical protein NL676_008982 [Syzygium grande]
MVPYSIRPSPPTAPCTATVASTIARDRKQHSSDSISAPKTRMIPLRRTQDRTGKGLLRMRSCDAAGTIGQTSLPPSRHGPTTVKMMQAFAKHWTGSWLT